MAPARDNPGVIAPPPLIFLGCGAAGYIIDTFWSLPLPWIIGRVPLGFALLGGGLLLSGWSVFQFIRHGTHPDPRHPTTTIIQTGPYRASRNPIYLAFAMIHLGVGVISAKAWILISLLPALLLIHFGVVRREERYLTRKFGEAYDTYRHSVRRWF